MGWVSPALVRPSRSPTAFKIRRLKENGVFFWAVFKFEPGYGYLRYPHVFGVIGWNEWRHAMDFVNGELGRTAG